MNERDIVDWGLWERLSIEEYKRKRYNTLMNKKNVVQWKIYKNI